MNWISNGTIMRRISNALINTASVQFQFNSRTSSLRGYEDIPGPKSYPLIGNMLDFKEFGGEFDFTDYRDFQVKLQAKYGDIVRWKIFDLKQVFLFNPDHIKKVFKADESIPFRPSIEAMNKLQKNLGIQGSLLNTQGDDWKRVRKAANPIIARPQTIHTYLKNHNEIGNDLVEVINKKFNIERDNMKNGSLMIESFNDMLRLVALEYISEVALDKRLKCLDESQREKNVSEFISMVNEFFVLIGKLTFTAPIWRYYPTKDWREFEKKGSYIYKLSSDFVLRAKHSKNLNDRTTIISQFLEHKDKYGLTDKEIVGLLADLIIAGTDTMSTALYYILYCLGIFPQVQENLYKEINSVLGDRTDLKESDIENMKYLKNVIKECMRYFSVAPANARVLLKDVMIENYLLPKGTHMILCNDHISKSERYFNDANKFDPSRWNKEEKNIHPYAALPFGVGARQCVGRRLAEQEVYITVIKLIQNFKIKYTGEKPKVKIGLVLAPDTPLNLEFSKRN